jgi:cell division protein FtsL
MKRTLIVMTMCLAPAWAIAQPDPAGSAAGAPQPPPSEPAPGTTDLRKTCVDAMNADPTFAASIVETADKKQNKERDDVVLKAHQEAQDRIAKNERHVILAYAAMWVVAAVFVLFLWRRQQGLKLEIVRLQKDLAAATKESEK